MSDVSSPQSAFQQTLENELIAHGATELQTLLDLRLQVRRDGRFIPDSRPQYSLTSSN